MNVETSRPTAAELNGQVAVVTGAAQGLGLAMAELLAERGASVIIADLQYEKAADAAEKSKTISEDQVKDLKDDVQKLTKKHEDEVDSIIAAKTKEIEEV